MRSNLVYMAISVCAGIIAIALVLFNVTETDEWEMRRSNQTIRARTANESWIMSGVYQRFEPPGEAGTIIITGHKGNSSDLEIVHPDEPAEASRGEAEWGEGRSFMDALPCSLKALRKGWDVLVISDNGYCGGVSRNMSGKYRRQPLPLAAELEGMYMANPLSYGEVGRLGADGRLNTVMVNLGKSHDEGAWSAAEGRLELSGTGQSDGVYDRVYPDAVQHTVRLLRQDDLEIRLLPVLPNEYRRYRHQLQ